jgi:LemA protein
MEFVTILIIIVAIVAYGIMVYNQLVAGRTQTQEAWSGIDVQLKRRHNLIPNLVETVKGYATHEQETLENVIAARQGAVQQTGGAAATGQSEGILTQALGRLFALSEAYPDLKASENFQNLQGELSALEDEIQMSRRFYNGTVRDYNIKVESFPSNLVANQFKFSKAEFFELDPSEAEAVKQVPKVDF